MSQDLMSQLASEGVLESRGAFALDEEMAREKMGKFQLQHPHGYVLEFFQAAVLLGASRVEVQVDADELWMSWTGSHALSPAHLESMYASVFQTSADLIEEGLKHLAIGMNAASSLNLAVQELRCVGAEGKVWRRAQAGEVVDLAEVAAREEEQGVPGKVSIYLKERFKPIHIKEFFSRMVREVEEATLLRERCRYGAITLVINGEELDTSFARHGDFVLCDTYEIEGGRIWLGLMPDKVGLDVELLQHGVLVGEARRMKAGTLGASLLVESSGFKKDISRASIVQDDHFFHIIRTEIVSCVHESMARYLEREGAEKIDPEHRARLLGDFLVALTQVISKRAMTPGEERLYKLARREPLFRLASVVRGEGGPAMVRTWMSIDKLVAMMARAGQDVLFHSHKDFDEVESERVILRAAQTHVRGGHDGRLARHVTSRTFLKQFATLLGVGVEDANAYLQVRKVALKNVRVWERGLERRGFDVMGGEARSLHQSDRHPGGEWLWCWEPRRHPGKQSRVTFYRDRKVLCHEVDALDDLLPGLELHVEMPLEMNITFSKIMYTSRQNQEVLAEVFQSFPACMMSCCRHISRHPELANEEMRVRIQRYLAHAACGTLHGFIRTELASLPSHQPREGEEVHEHWRLPRTLQDVSPAQRLEVLSNLDVLGTLPLFAAMDVSTMRVVTCSLIEIEHQMRAQRGRVKYIPRQESVLQLLHRLTPERRPASLVLLMREEDRQSWEELFSVYLMEDITVELQRAWAHQAFLTRPVVELGQVPERCIERDVREHERGMVHTFLLEPPELSDLIAIDVREGSVEIGGDAQLEVGGVLFRGEQPAGQLDVMFLHEGRVIESWRRDVFPFGLCKVRVECDRYRVRNDYRGLLRDRSYQQLVRKLEAHARAFARERFEALASRVAELDEREHAELWGTLFRMSAAIARGEVTASEDVTCYERANVFELERMHGRREFVSLRELRELMEESEHLLYLDAGEKALEELRAGVEGVLSFPFARSRRLFAHYEPDVKLKHCALTDSTRQMLEEARARFVARPVIEDLTHPPAPYGATVLRHEVFLLPGHWQMAMFWWLDEREHESMLGGMRIDMLHERRVLQSVVKFLSVGRLSVTVDARDLPVDPEYRGFVKNTHFYELLDLIEERVRETFSGWIEERARDFEQIGASERCGCAMPCIAVGRRRVRCTMRASGMRSWPCPCIAPSAVMSTAPRTCRRR